MAEFGETLCQRGHVVIGQHEGVAGEIGGYAGGTGVAEGEQAAAGFDQQAVGMAVVAAFKFHDFVAAGIAARQADGRHGGFGTRADQTHALDAGHQFGDFFRYYSFCGSRRAERQTAQGRFAYRFHHFRVGVADNRRPPSADVVDIAHIVFIPHISPFGFFDKTRDAADAAEGAHG